MNNKQSTSMSKDETKIPNKKRPVFTYVLFAIFFIIISVVSFLLIYNYTGSDRFAVFSLLPVHVYLQLIILTFIFYLMDTLRFYYMLKAIDVHIKFRYMFGLNTVNIFVSTI